MAEHVNVDRIRNGYVAFTKGDVAALDKYFADDILWHVSGRNKLSGDFRGRDAVYGYVAKLRDATEGTLHLDVQTVVADDEHGVAQVVTSASRAGRSVTTNSTHVCHMRDGMLVEFWSIHADQDALDELIG